VLYLDTSAFLKLYIREAGSEQVQSMVVSQFEPLPVWEILEMELCNALNLKVFRGELEDERISRPIFALSSASGERFLFCS